MQRALELDPVSPLFNSSLAHKLYSARRFDAAIEQERKTLDMDPSFPPARFTLGYTYAVKGMYRQALAEFGKLSDRRREVYAAYMHARLAERLQVFRNLAV